MLEPKRGAPKPISGLDMAPTINWYTVNKDNILSNLPRAVEKTSLFPLVDTQHFSLSSGEVAAAIDLFPQPALLRSRLRNGGSIIGKPTLYFAADATPEAIKTTSDVKDALSPTAIIPSYTDNTKWRQTDELSSDVWLFALPNVVDPTVGKIIHMEGLIHEIAHTVVSQLLYTKGYKLKLPSGEVVNGLDFATTFAEAAEKHPPISHYASFYRKAGEKFKDKMAIDEEMVETIAAYLLEFAFCDDEARRLDPLSDRLEVKEMIQQFLNAEVVESSTQ